VSLCELIVIPKFTMQTTSYGTENVGGEVYSQKKVASTL
jgi:hypothetical protein